MGNSKSLTKFHFDAEELVAKVAQLPTVHVDREKYLRSQFDQFCDEKQLEQIVLKGPGVAGISARRINQLALSSIAHETTLVSALSAAAGLPGGWALAGTIPADIAQFHGAMLRVSQKLAYMHGWPELFENNSEKMDDNTKGVMMVFLATMYGIKGAASTLATFSSLFSTHVEKTLFKAALTKGSFYPAFKAAAKHVGIKINKSVFSKGVSKLIPIAGAIISGTVTMVTFRKMSLTLHKHLGEMERNKRRALKTAQ
jgi:hypothetical protein